MPCTSIVVLQQSTHTYVIKLRGSGTILAIVTPNADQHKGPHQSRSKPTLALHKCSPALEITALRSRVQTNVIGPCWSHLAFVIISVQSHLLSVLAFLWMMSADGWWWEFNGGKDKGWQTFWSDCKDVADCLYVCFSVWGCVCASKGKRRWLCQGVSDNRGLFSTVGRVRLMWWMASSLAPFFTPLSSPASGDLGWGGGLLGLDGWGWACLALVRQRLSALKKKKKSSCSGSF